MINKLQKFPFFNKIKQEYSCLENINFYFEHCNISMCFKIKTIIKTKTNNQWDYILSISKYLYLTNLNNNLENFIFENFTINEFNVINFLTEEQKKYETILLLNKLEKELPVKKEIKKKISKI